MNGLDGIFDGSVELVPLIPGETLLSVGSQAIHEPVPRPAHKVYVVHVIGKHQMGLLYQRIGHLDTPVVILFGASVQTAERCPKTQQGHQARDEFFSRVHVWSWFVFGES